MTSTREVATHSERLTLSVPTRAAYIATVRNFLGSVGVHYGLPEEKIEDLKLVVSEICGGASELSAVGRIWVRIARSDSSLDIEVAWIGHATSDESGDGDQTKAFRGRLIDALLPDATFEPTEDGMSVRFTVTASDG